MPKSTRKSSSSRSSRKSKGGDVFSAKSWDLGLGELGKIGGLGGMGLGLESYGDAYMRSMLAPQLLQTKLVEKQIALALQQARIKQAMDVKTWQLNRQMASQQATIGAYKHIADERKRNMDGAMRSNEFPGLRGMKELSESIQKIVDGQTRIGGGGGIQVGTQTQFQDYDNFSDYGDVNLFSGNYY